jgi:hypothetical protein
MLDDLGQEHHSVNGGCRWCGRERLPADWKIFSSKTDEKVYYLQIPATSGGTKYIKFNTIGELEDYVDSLED